MVVEGGVKVCDRVGMRESIDTGVDNRECGAVVPVK